jgi:hypothetical protein
MPIAAPSSTTTLSWKSCHNVSSATQPLLS